MKSACYREFLKSRLNFSLKAGCVGILFGILQSTSAFAYIPPSSFIIKTWLNKHQGMKSIKIRSLITAYEDGKPTSIRFKESLVYQADSSTLKSWALDDKDERIYGLEKKLNSIALPLKLLFSTDVMDVSLSMKARKISLPTLDDPKAIENTSLARANKSIAWVLGTQEPQKSPSQNSTIKLGDRSKEYSQVLKEPQVWFEKDTFLPLRLVSLNPSDQEAYDLKFENYHFYREFPYPTTMTVSKGSQGILFSIQIIEVVVNGDTSSLKTLHHGNIDPGFTSVGRSAPTLIKDLVRQYYDVVR